MARKKIFLYTTDPGKELDRLLRSRTPRFRRALLDAWNEQAHLIKTGAIHEALMTGRLPEEVMQEMAAVYSKFVVDRMDPLWTELSEHGMNNVLDRALTLTGNVTEYLESSVYTAAKAVLDDRALTRGATWVRDISDLQSKAIKNIIDQYGIRARLPAQEVARFLEPTVGLLPREAGAVAKYRAVLIDKAGGTSTKTVERAVAAKAARLHNARAVRIARTEMAWAHNQGMTDAAKTARDAGLLPDDLTPIRRWETAEDETVCDVCGPMQGETTTLEGTFKGGITAPAHPNCRCSILIQLVDASGQDYLS